MAEQPEKSTKTTKTAATATDKTESVAAFVSKTPYIYLGPSLQTVPLRQNSTYVGGIPKQFQEVYDTNPDVRFLFVDSHETAADYRIALKDPSSEHSWVFNQIKESGV